MPKKIKKIEKEAKEEKKVESSEITKNQSTEAPHQLNDIFTQSFRKRVAQYIFLNDEVFEQKQKLQGGNLTNEIKERKNRMALKLQQAASVILKDELKSLQEWINDQKEKVDQQIKKINKAYESSRISLLDTGSFNEEEIKAQLANIQKKTEQKQKMYESYDTLLKRSKAVYE